MYGQGVCDSRSYNGDSSPEKMKSSGCSYMRKRNKPLMEKRRRARINDALVQLKALVLESMQQDTTQYSKLEKADILEMTVSHVASLQKLQIIDGARHGVSPISKYRVGFNECANEVIRYLGEYRDGTCSELRTRLLNHLAGCIETSNFMRRGTIGDAAQSPGNRDQKVGDKPNRVGNCVHAQSEGHLRDITFQTQHHDCLVSSGNGTFPLQRDSTKRQLRFHGNQLSADESLAQTMYSGVSMQRTSQSEESKYGPLISRNLHVVEIQNNVQMALDSDDSDGGKGVVIETNIENTFHLSDVNRRQQELYAFRRAQPEQEARVSRASMLNRHVNQLSSARATYGNGPLPLFTRTDNNNNRLVGGQADFNFGALDDGFNRQNQPGTRAVLVGGENNKSASNFNKHSRQFGTNLQNINSVAEKAPAPCHVGFSSESVWRPW